MSIRVLPLKGHNSITALNTFHRLLLGLKMLPMYIEEDYETFYQRFNDKTESEKEKFLRQALAFVKLEKDEVESIVCLATDMNGIPYTSVNLKNIGLEDLFETIVAVGMEISKIKIRLVSEDEKKK